MKQCITCNAIKDELEFYKQGPRNGKPRNGRLTECKECHRKRSKRNSSPEIKRFHMVHFKFGITKEQYLELLEKFPNCGICHKEFGNNEPTVDHCHLTNKIRGLLCINCNAGLGRFKDRIDLIELAIDYLNQT